MTLENAVKICRSAGLTGWELVEFAQCFVNQNMKYSITNSLDSPQEAFEKGQGYCWHQASVLNMILLELGFDSLLAHATKNLFTDIEIEGVVVKELISGHIWCRVIIDGTEKDVCPGNAKNRPSAVHFKPRSKVLKWNAWYAFWSYYGSALLNSIRQKEIENLKQKQHAKWNPDYCSCKKTSCQRYKKCVECKEYHYSKKGLPSCER